MNNDNPHQLLVAIGPCNFWQSFRFCYKLERASIWYQICRSPRGVIVRVEDLNQALEEWVKLGLPLPEKPPTAE